MPNPGEQPPDVFQPGGGLREDLLTRDAYQALRESLPDTVIRLLREALQRARDHQRPVITPMDLLISLLTAANSIVAECFERIGVTAAKLTEYAVIAEQSSRDDREGEKAPR